MTDSKNNDKDKDGSKKKPEVSKNTIKDLKVKPGKEKDVMGGGGGSPSKPRTPADYTCPAC